MTNTISNTDDTIDSRDIIERIVELQDTRDSLQTDYDDAVTALDEFEDDPSTFAQDGSTPDELREAVEAAKKALDTWNTSDDAEELRILEALQEEASGYSPDWTYGSQLIRRSYFEQAMDEMVADCYGDQYTKDLPSFMTLTLDYDALEQDYTGVDFGGVEYLIR